MEATTPASRVPVLTALACQAVCLPLALLVSGLLAAFTPAIPVAPAFVPAQGALAAWFTRHRLPAWWRWIQFLLPFAAWAALGSEIPPAAFLAAFLISLGLFWTTFRTRVPLFPTHKAVTEAVASLLPRDRPFAFADLGSGTGGFLLSVASARPRGSFTGIESAPLPWFASLLRARVSSAPIRFIRGDYAACDLGCYDVVYTYLSPAAMPAIWQKARAEMRPGSLLLSHEFPVPGLPPAFTLRPAAAPGHVLYGWRM